MSAPWAQALCEAGRADESLSGNPIEFGWVRNDATQGLEVTQIYGADSLIWADASRWHEKGAAE
jgi:hypothetical protein